jgi:hypothetical protein
VVVVFDCTFGLYYTETRIKEKSTRIVYQELRSEIRPEMHVNSIVIRRFDIWNSCSASLSDLPNDSPTKQLAQQRLSQSFVTYRATPALGAAATEEV